MEQSCTRRSVIYETHCATCLERETERIMSLDLEEQEKKRMISEIKRYVYIGESARSAYERLWEPQRALKQLSPDSHMLKHIVAVHGEEEIEEIEFHAKIIKYTRTAFERQIRESTLIQESRETSHILNSKAEYNRCSLPRLTTKLGEKETKDWLKKHEKTLREEKEQDLELRKRIFEIRKERNKQRGAEKNTDSRENPSKRRKIDEQDYRRVIPDQRAEQTKRQSSSQDSDQPRKRSKGDIREHLLSKNINLAEKLPTGWNKDEQLQ